MLRDTFDLFPFLDDTLSFLYSPDHRSSDSSCCAVLYSTSCENPIRDPLFSRSLQWQFSSPFKFKPPLSSADFTGIANRNGFFSRSLLFLPHIHLHSFFTPFLLFFFCFSVGISTERITSTKTPSETSVLFFFLSCLLRVPLPPNTERPTTGTGPNQGSAKLKEGLRPPLRPGHTDRPIVNNNDRGQTLRRAHSFSSLFLTARLFGQLDIPSHSSSFDYLHFQL